jgi:asparagine synthase (glutamine-hydrolysing)
MCGITGVFAFKADDDRFVLQAERANDRLKKRGPDGGKVYVKQSTALGHRRLSIIDVSCAGDQPMSTPDQRYTIVFNGEIFNYQELRDVHLTASERASLRSTSDTEVFLLLFARLGEESFLLLRGFFAAAIYDNNRDVLTLVRDRFGKKPLLYYRDAERLCFASEMKALFEMGIPREINWTLLPLYLQLTYIPQPYSMIQGVQKVPAGHYMTISKSEVTTHRYYELNIHTEQYKKFNYEQAQAELHRIMDDSVRLRLISDVPLGAFLSGGIDSSVVVALAARHTTKLKTFSIGYKDNPFFDETAYAGLVAKKYQTEHTVFSLSNADFLEHVHDVLHYIDEPFADSSAIPEFILSYYTRKHVTVALSGDGGDEVFGGYNKHAAEWRMRNGGLLNKAVQLGMPVWTALPKSRNQAITNKFRQLHRFAAASSLSAPERYWQWASFTEPERVRSLLHPSIAGRIDQNRLDCIKEQFTRHIQGKDLNEILLADMNLVLPGDMLVKVDLMSMANSLEIRSPFLDQEVVDFAFSLPSEVKVNGQMKKRIVQDAFRQDLPPELYNRRKQGFEIPMLEWFRKELWGLINDDLLQDEFVAEQQVFDLAAVQQLKKKLHSSNPGDSHVTVWSLIVFQHWWKHYIAG